MSVNSSKNWKLEIVSDGATAELFYLYFIPFRSTC